MTMKKYIVAGIFVCINVAINARPIMNPTLVLENRYKGTVLYKLNSAEYSIAEGKQVVLGDLNSVMSLQIKTNRFASIYKNISDVITAMKNVLANGRYDKNTHKTVYDSTTKTAILVIEASTDLLAWNLGLTWDIRDWNNRGIQYSPKQPKK